MSDGRELPSDADLIARYLQGKPGAWEAIQHRCLRQVQRVVADHFPADPDAREDALQDTWVRLCGSLHHFRGHSSLLTYAARLARNACLDLLRKRQRQPHEAELAEAEALADPQSSISPERAGPLWECFDALPELEQKVLQARADLEGKQCDEIAARLGLQVDEVYEVLYRARQAMKKCLASKGFLRKTTRPERPEEGGCT